GARPRTAARCVGAGKRRATFAGRRRGREYGIVDTKRTPARSARGARRMKRTLVMHPRTEQLLSIRDGVCDTKWQNHLRECAQCAAHLEALERTRTRLR